MRALSTSRRLGPPFAALALLAAIVGLLVTGAFADNTDQTNGGNTRFAWGENSGWLKARPAAEPYGAGGVGVQVTDTALSGWLWGENLGWVSLSCANRGTCAANPYGVTNDGAGHLGGFAWGENAGWINFSCANRGTCGANNYGVTISMPGMFDYLPDWGHFSGFAWGENVGWINFGDAGFPVTYRIQTGWPDSDGDGWPDSAEIAIGKNPFVYCVTMRADINNDGAVNGLDLNQLAKYFTQTVPPAPARVDINNPPDKAINGLDLNVMAGKFTHTVIADC